MRIAFSSVLLVMAGCGGPADVPTVASCRGICTSPALSTLDLLLGRPGGPGWVDAVGAAAHFSAPWSLDGDGAGHLYVTDGGTIRAIDLASARVTTLAGSSSLVGGDDGLGSDARFHLPSGIAASGASVVYVADTENDTIRRIDVLGGMVRTVAGAFGVAGTTDDAGTAARFREPEGLVLDESGNLYIVDTDNNVIRKQVLSTGAVTTIAGTPGLGGSTDGKGGAARFNRPRAMARDTDDNLYILDTLNQSVRRLRPSDGTVSTVATFAGAALPVGIAVDGSDLYVSLADHRIVRIAAQTGITTDFAGAAGVAAFVDGTGPNARFFQPAGLWTDGAGALYVADSGNYAIRRMVIATSVVSTFAGAQSLGPGHLDGTGSAARFSAPRGMVADAHGTLYLADTDNSTIRKVTIATGEVTTIAGAAGQLGQVDSVGQAARFNQPAGLALDEKAAVLYIADSENAVLRRLDLATSTVTTPAINIAPSQLRTYTGLSTPTGLALDGTHLYITDFQNDDVLALDLQTMTIAILAGAEGVPGPVDGVGGQARFHGPSGIVADGAGLLYVADVLNHAIRRIAIDSGATTTLAGQLGTQGSDDGPGAAAHFSNPSQLAIDQVGDLFVSDSGNNTVRHIDLATTLRAVTTIIGTSTVSGVSLGRLPAQLTYPLAIALLPVGAGGLAVVSENSILLAH